MFEEVFQDRQNNPVAPTAGQCFTARRGLMAEDSQ